MFHQGQPVILPKPAEYAQEGSRGTAAEDLELTENPAKPGFRYERAQRVYRSINVSHATRLPCKHFFHKLLVFHITIRQPR
jgi:hypothetical protein